MNTRVTLVPVRDDESPNIVVDMTLLEGGIPSDRAVAFGALGGLSETSLLIEPFLLRRNGDVDFGTYCDADERYHHLNLRGEGRPVVLDALFTFRSMAVPYDAEIIYRVDRLTPLV